MKARLNRNDAKTMIDEFFVRKDFEPEEAKKIKRLAMKFNIKLGEYRKLFCKKCYNKLKGRITVSKTHKAIECVNCREVNKFRISK